MEVIKFLILSKDKDYAHALCKCARNLNINVSFSYADELKDNLSSYSMIILDGFKKEQLKNMERKINCPCCYLTDNEQKENKITKEMLLPNVKEKGEKKKRIYVYKYKKLTMVLSHLMDIFTYYTGNSLAKVFSGIKSCKLYTLTSSLGGAGATSIAMGLAQDMAFAGGNKTLYLSLGEYHQELNFAKGNQHKNLREYLYDFYYGNRTYCENIFSYLINLKENLYIFNVNGGDSQFSTLNEKQFIEFIQFIVEKNFFDRIVVDIGTNLKSKWNGVYKISSCNILINSLMDSWYQEQFWMEYNRKIGNSNEKSLVVENRCSSVESNVNIKLDEVLEQSTVKTSLWEEEKEQMLAQRQRGSAGKLVDYISNLNNSLNNSLSNMGKEDEPMEIPDKVHVISRKKKQNKIRIEEDESAFLRNDGFVNINLDSKFGEGIRKMVMALADLNKIN